jgi:hypothetical protein
MNNQMKLRTLYNFGFSMQEREEKKYIYEVMFGDKVGNGHIYILKK